MGYYRPADRIDVKKMRKPDPLNDTKVLSSKELATGAYAPTEVQVLDDQLYWLETRPKEKGRNTLLTLRNNGNVIEVTPSPFNVKTKVYGYGGKGYIATEHGLFFINNGDGRLYKISNSGIRPITKKRKSIYFADLHWDAKHHRIIAVQESYREGKEASHKIVAINVCSGAVQLLHEGQDFYSSPRVSPCGKKLAFVYWNHPNMPWDETKLMILTLSKTGSPLEENKLGIDNESIGQPEWSQNHLFFISDRNGYWNLYKFDGQEIQCCFTDENDYADPSWVLGTSSYAIIDCDLLALARTSPTGGLVLVNHKEQNAEEVKLNRKATSFSYLARFRKGFCCVTEYSQRLPEVIYYSITGKKDIVLAPTEKISIPSSTLQKPSHVEFPTRDGRKAWAQIYKPRSTTKAKYDKSPLLLMIHGGPTGNAKSSLNLKAQYYATRGWFVADIDYRGSSGYGREYRQALLSKWGVQDVSDCEDLTKYMLETMDIDPSKVAIRGSSAGGYTVLATIANTKIFSAAACHYGISDLEELSNNTHKFESRYIERLVGGKGNLFSRSPINKLSAISCPTILFHGADDSVVNAQQSYRIHDALQKSDIKTKYIEFREEGHGFRIENNIICAIELEYAFLAESLGINKAH